METASDVITFKYSCTGSELNEGIALLVDPTPDASKARETSRKRRTQQWIAVAAISALDIWVFYVLILCQIAAMREKPNGIYDHEVLRLVIFANLMIVGLLLTKIASRFARVADSKRKACWSIDAQMTIGASGVVESGRGVRCVHTWDHFRGADESGRVIILRTRADAAFIIPKRLFRDESERTRAVQMMQAFTTRPALQVRTGFEVVQ